ncbi:MAG: hypothetical protein Q7S16_04325 [bacterium]|nr:hypothetical protein [bacterium]
MANHPCVTGNEQSLGEVNADPRLYGQFILLEIVKRDDDECLNRVRILMVSDKSSVFEEQGRLNSEGCSAMLEPYFVEDPNKPFEPHIVLAETVH